MSLMRRREFLRRSLLATAGSAAFTSVYAKLNLAQAASLPSGLLKSLAVKATSS